MLCHEHYVSESLEIITFSGCWKLQYVERNAEGSMQAFFFFFFFNPLPFCEAYNMACSLSDIDIVAGHCFGLLVVCCFCFYSYLPLHSKKLSAPALW